MSALQAVAVNLQTWRLRRGMSVSALARAADVSKSTVSELERCHGNPSLDTLWALARALSIPFGYLFNSHDGEAKLQVVRESDPSGVTIQEPGYLARLVAGWAVDGELEVYVITIDEGVRRNSDSHGPGVIEHAITIAGRVDIGVGDESAELGPGDFITFPADQPHHYAALEGQGKIIAIHQYPRSQSELGPVMRLVTGGGADYRDSE
jgi:transcriptional regulator with XRE-family HTH domain